jgi:hypothetical protein
MHRMSGRIVVVVPNAAMLADLRSIRYRDRILHADYRVVRYPDIATNSKTCSRSYAEDHPGSQTNAVSHIPSCAVGRNDLDAAINRQSFPYVGANCAKPQPEP